MSKSHSRRDANALNIARHDTHAAPDEPLESLICHHSAVTDKRLLRALGAGIKGQLAGP